MSVINTNILSLTTQNNLKSSQLSLNSAIQRLSSGMRINSAKDDAAGQAIANRFSANIRGLSQAQRNANDGISLAQTTEGALGEINTNLQRIRELAVQSANGSNSNADKASIQAEITQRLAEIDRTSAQTDFNGVKVLAADSKLSVQVGANDGETIEIDLEQIDSNSLGLGGFSVAGKALPVSEAITQTNLGATPAAVDLDAAATSLGVDKSTLSLHNVLDKDGAATAAFVVKSGTDFYAASVDNATGAVSLNVTDLEFTDPDNGVTTATALDDQLVKVGVDAAGAATGYVTVQGKNYSRAAGSIANGGAAGTDFDSTATDIALSGGSATGQFDGASSVDPMKLIDAALNKVDDLRGSLGAVQNRFDSVISNLGTTINNLKSSRSRIEDADYATEVSNMSRAQILQQAGTSVLAQANQTTQGVLSLLR